ncbi:MAG: methyltransferase domain-containing protein [Nocardiopsaceae bacterium]|nr:methyltransferase domain-containing protein [Nocardiopsaceae bacterium]
MNKHHPMLERVYALSTPDECESTYDEWAVRYEHDTTEEMGYAAPERAAARLAELIRPAEDGTQPSVLDAGCGTGLVGAALARNGLTAIDGIDISAAMLDQARAKGVYRSLAKADLTRKLSFPDSGYDAVICVGTLTEGHVGPEAMDELVRVARPGAPVVLTILDRIWEPQGYRARVAELEHRGAAVLEEAVPGTVYHAKENITCTLVVLRAGTR